MNDSSVIAWENVKEIDKFIPIVKNQIQNSTHKHTHEFFELVYVEKGFCLHFSDETVGLLMAGDLIFIFPGQSHYYRCRDNVNIWNIMFMPESLDGFMEDICALQGMMEFFSCQMKESMHVSLSPPNRKLAERIIGEMHKESQERVSGWALRMKALLIDLIVLLSRVFGIRFPEQNSKQPKKEMYMGYVLDAIKLIESEFANAITVSGIAKQLGIGPDHLTRQFNQILGITPTEYIHRCRHAKALELLRKQYMVRDVCLLTGFKQQSYFSREFKSRFNMTPTEFQKQVREQQ